LAPVADPLKVFPTADKIEQYDAYSVEDKEIKEKSY